jgi:hypothetical protein
MQGLLEGADVSAVFAFSASYPVYVLAQVKADEGATDPTGDTVQMAFLQDPPEEAAPASGDWKTASWTTLTSTNPARYKAKCLVGPGGVITLTAGTWWVWVKVTDSPETPALYSGRVQVTP